MHPTVRTALVVTVVALAFLGGWAAGSLLTPAKPGSSANARSNTLSIIGAGTLGVFFPAVANALVNETPAISAPTAAQTYEGSLLAMAAVKASGATPDVTAAADYRLIPRLLEPTAASYEVIFATTPEVLAYDPTVSAFTGINTSNWADRLQSPGVVLGVANASTDPNGYNGIFTLQLQGLLENGSLSAVYDHFYTTPVGSYGAPNPTTARIEPEAQASTLLASHVVSAFVIYRSYAVQHHLSFVDLDPSVDLGGLDAGSIAHYALASTSIIGSSGGQTVITGAPVAFAASVPTAAANATLGQAFLHLLLSPEGAALATANGFHPIFPGWADRPSSLPALLRPDVVPFPSGLPAP